VIASFLLLAQQIEEQANGFVFALEGMLDDLSASADATPAPDQARLPE